MHVDNGQSATKRMERLASVVLTGMGLLCLVVFGYLVSRHGLATRYLVLPVGAAALFLCFRLAPGLRVNLALCLFSIIVSVFTAELTFALLNPGRISSCWLVWPGGQKSPQLYEQLARNHHGAFDTRSRLEVIDDLRRQGFDAYPEIPAPVRLREDPSRQAVPVFSVDRMPFLPLAGISHTLTVMCNESGQYVTYQSDEHGFNNPQGLWNRFPMKIALVGDSFTLGFCVDASKNFGAVLRQRYPSTLNLGVGGSGPLWQLATIKEYLGGIKPRVTLWVYYEGNDLQDLEREMRSRHLIRYLSDTFTDGLLQRQPEIDKTLKTYVERMKDLETPLGRFKHNVLAASTNLPDAAERLVKFTAIRERLSVVYAGCDEPGATGRRKARADAMRLFERVLFEASRAVNEWGGTLIFVYLPHWARYGNPASADKDRDGVLALVSTLGLRVIDIHGVFADQADPLELFPFRRSGHYNERGHHIVGEALLRFLHASGLLAGQA